ncbi:hypothetical protein HOH51_02435 [bacterium]|jgi:PKD repeat protein|nr:hypothetical protein [bacterium]
MKLIKILLSTLLWTSFAFAATIEPNSIINLINSEDFTRIDEPIVFEAESFSDIETINEDSIKYVWDFGNQNQDQGKKVLHRYQKPGNYKVSLSTTYKGDTFTATKDIFVSKTNILVVTDHQQESENIQQFKKTAESFDIYVNTVSAYNNASSFVSSEILSQKISNNSNLQQYEYIIDWTSQSIGKNTIQKVKQKNTNSFKNITYINLSKATQVTISKKQKKQLSISDIITMKKSALYTLLESESKEDFLKRLDTQQHEYQIHGASQKLSDKLPFTKIFNFMRENGVTEQSLYLIIIIPLLALSITFAKQVIGIEAIGFYTPLITSLSLLYIGINVGTIIFIGLYIFSYFVQKYQSRNKFHYLAKNALLVSCFSLITLIVLSTLTYLQGSQASLINIAIFPMVVLITIVESFAKQIYMKGYKVGSKKVFSTYLVCIAAYILAGGTINIFSQNLSFTHLKDLLMQVPDLTLVLIALIVYLGNWKGLKLIEYYKIKQYNDNIEE